jgi:hypothetical protein
MNNKIIYSLVIGILIIPVFFPLSEGNINDIIIVNSINDQSIKVKLNAAPYKLIKLDSGKIKIEMKGFNSVLTPALPKLPVKTFLIAIPEDCILSSISLLNENKVILEGEYNLENASPISDGVNIESYISDKFSFFDDIYLPKKPYEFQGMGKIGLYSYAQIRFYPFSYCPIRGSLTLYKNIEIRIDFQKDETYLQNKNINLKTEQLASELITNYEKIYYNYNKESTKFSNQNFPYLIISTTPCEQYVNFLKNWREITLGNPVKIVNISWIDDNYDGKDLAEKIRSFLIEKYPIWGIQYLLIVGSNSYIPMRKCYPNKDDHSSSAITYTDFYYADLTGNWDKDEDGFYGEREDDSPDFSPEIYVGRIPIDDPAKLKNICQKIIDFEQNNDLWKKKALLLGAILNFAGEDHNENYDKTDGAVLIETLKNNILRRNNFDIITMYEKEGMSPSIYDCDTPLNRENVRQYWSEGYAIVNWNAHGSPWDSIRKYWKYDDGDGVPENIELSEPRFITTSDASYLTNEKPSIVFSCSCKNAKPDEDALGVSILNQGGVAFVGATSTSWSTVGWEAISDGGIQTINYDFLNYFLNKDYSCGESLYNALFKYYNDYDWWGWKTYQNTYGFCLYGDPAFSTEVFTGFSSPDTPPVPQGKSNGNVSEEIFFTSSTTDPDGQDVYYKWDWGDGEKSELLGPYPSGLSIQTSHEWDEPGLYKIKVKAIDSIGAESDWSNEFLITIFDSQVEIKSIKGGIGKVKAVISNMGGIKTTDILWRIEINKTFSNSSYDGKISTLSPGEDKTIKSDIIFGLGKITVTVKLIDLKKEKTKQGMLIGPFIFI